MRYSLLFVLSLISYSLSAQVANNISLLAQWQDPELPDAGNFSYNDVWGYTACDGREYGIFGSSAFVHFFDVTNPTDIVEVAAFEGGSTTVWRDFKTYEDYAYAVCDNCAEGMMIFDMSNLPETVTLVQQNTEYFTAAHNVWVDEPAGRLYVVGTNTNSQGVHIFDISEDPGNPVLLGEPVLPGGYVHDINVVNHLGYASSGNNGLYVYDFENAVTPELLGTLTEYPESGYNHSSWPSADGTHLVMADETFDRGLKILNVEDLTDITVTDVFRSELLAPEATGSIAHNPFVRGDYVFISYYHDGLQVFDISNPSEAVQVAGYDTEPGNVNYNGFTGMWGTYPYLPSGTILCSDTHHGFFTMQMDSLDLAEVSPPLNPEQPVLAEQGDTEVCAGQSVPLFVSPVAESYIWMKNGEVVLETDANNFSAEESGDYTVVTANAYCRVPAEETITVTVNPYPDAELITAGDLFLCGSADTEPLSISAGADSYIWYLDGEQLTDVSGSILDAQIPGEYTVEVIANTCLSESNSLTINGVGDELNGQIEPSSVAACEGQTIELSINEEYDNYQWTLDSEEIVGATGASLSIEESGEYAYYVNFTADCSISSAAITATFFEPITPTFTENMNVLVANNATAWQWYFNGNPIEGATEQSYTATQTGSYSVETVDENGCTANSESMDLVISGLYEVAQGAVQILPNPISDRLELRFDTNAQKAHWRIFDVTGRILEQNSGLANQSFFVHTADWSAGMYFLEVILDGNFVLTEKIMKK